MNVLEELASSSALQDVTNVEILSVETDPACLSSCRSTIPASVEGHVLGISTLLEEKDDLLPAEHHILTPTSAKLNDEGLHIRHMLPSPSSSDDQLSEKHTARALRKRKLKDDLIHQEEKRSKTIRIGGPVSVETDKIPLAENNASAPRVWCRRCGCSNTSRWRAGPLGTNS